MLFLAVVLGLLMTASLAAALFFLVEKRIDTAGWIALVLFVVFGFLIHTTVHHRDLAGARRDQAQAMPLLGVYQVLKVERHMDNGYCGLLIDRKDQRIYREWPYGSDEPSYQQWYGVCLTAIPGDQVELRKGPFLEHPDDPLAFLVPIPSKA